MEKRLFNMIPLKIKYWWQDRVRSISRKVTLLKIMSSGGYKCNQCGVSLPGHWTEIHSEVNGKKFMLMNCVHNELICSACLAIRIDTWFNSAHVEKFTFKPCYWYPKNEVTTNIIIKFKDPVAQDLNLDVRFGHNWWNGWHASNAAFYYALVNNPKMRYTTGLMLYENEQFFYVDKNGHKWSTNDGL